MKNKKPLLIISIIAIISFLIIFYFNLLEVNEQAAEIAGGGMMMGRRLPIPIEQRLWITPVLLLIAIVPLSYYLISQRLETKLENNMKILMKIIGKNNISKDSKELINKEAVLKLLNFNERKVLERLIKRKGEALQSEISRMDGMNKLKTHRAIKNLELKGVIETENNGKTNRIMLSKDIKGILLK